MFKNKSRMERDEWTGVGLFPADGPSHRYDDSKVSSIKIEKHEKENLDNKFDNVANIVAQMKEKGLTKEAMDVLKYCNAIPSNGYWEGTSADRLGDDIKRLQDEIDNMED